MATLVLTVLGDDQPGLVDKLSGVIKQHGGNWDTSHMARLAGKFAGIVSVSVADTSADALMRDLDTIEATGLLDIAVERVDGDVSDDGATVFTLELFGQDHPGIVHDISHALAAQNVSIEELRTDTSEAPMSGGVIFTAEATLRAPAGFSIADIRSSLESLANDLMVDIDLN